MPKPTKDQITLLKQKIDKDPATAFRVLAAIWDRQQPSEKETGKYAGSDGAGFQEDETEDANALYQRYIKAGKMWQKMGVIDVIRCQRMMGKYAKQYLSAQVDGRDREIQRFKINKHAPRPKLGQGERDRIMRNVENMTELPG